MLRSTSKILIHGDYVRKLVEISGNIVQGTEGKLSNASPVKEDNSAELNGESSEHFVPQRTKASS